MTDIQTYLGNLQVTMDFPSANARRKELISRMEELEKGSVHCFSCPGTCCTFQANSMQITPIEALEILASLNINSFSALELEEFKKRMQSTISQYRLDVEIYTAKRSTSALRKTYTCPFFNHGALGCSLSRSSKPYGCLGFNPRTSDDNGKSCSSETGLLEDREEAFLKKESEINTLLEKELGLTWKKQSIPQAILSVLHSLKI